MDASLHSVHNAASATDNKYLMTFKIIKVHNTGKLWLLLHEAIHYI